MKLNIKLICVFVFLSICVFTWSVRSEASNASAIETSFLSLKSPSTLYLNNCARCHGADGKGETEQGRLNNSPNISGGRLRNRSIKRLTNTITNGDNKMPAFGKRLKKAQIASLVNYVRGL